MNKPNILIFMTDHQRGDTAPPYNKAITPNLDKFSKDAVAFSETYCPSPHCCPSRATFFTGLYPSQHGVWNNVDVGNTLSRGLYDNTRLWSDELKESGYDLYFTGKWHISSEEGPADRGWDVTYTTEKYYKDEGHRPPPHKRDWEIYLNNVICKGNEERKEAQIIRPGYMIYEQYGLNETPFGDIKVIESAVESILNRPDNDIPWCHYVGTLGPHDPYFVPQRFLDMYDFDKIQLPKNYSDDMRDKPALYSRTRDRYKQLSELEYRKSILHYLAFCSYEDYLFGKLLEALEKSGKTENTIVVYASDHGDYMGEHGLWAKGLPCFKGAYHVPLLIKWPDGIVNPGRVVNEFANLADFAPTILDIAGVKTKSEYIGMSLVPFLKGKKPEKWRDAVYTQTNGNELYGIQRSVMTKEWKYVYNGFDYDELYNIREDPDETTNLIGNPDCDAIVKDMCKRMWKFAYKVGDVCIHPYIMISHAPYGPGIIFND